MTQRMTDFEAWARARLAGEPEVEDRRLVFGEGRGDRPPICLVGEAPGGEEERMGRPFVGKAGRNLDTFLAAVGLQREAIWITNTVKVRPAKVSPRGTISNRPPSREEKRLFLPILQEELRRLQPTLVVTLGNTALQALLGPEATVGACHGRLTEAWLPERETPPPLFALYHPASVIYNPALEAVYREDLRLLALQLGKMTIETGN